MRKFLTVLRPICLCFLACVMLAACQKEHEHACRAEWEKNAEYHWRACTDEECTEVTGKAEHYWDDGKVTALPSAESNGEKTFTCVICGATRGVPISFS